MVGQDTELDRTIIEAIRDPLTHIVRNVVDDLRADVWGWSSGKGGERGVPGSSRGGRNRRARWFSKNERRAWRRRVDAPESSYAMV